jgi:hypothetical protein
LQALAKPVHRGIVDLNGEYSSIRAHRPSQPAGEKTIACSDVGNDCTWANTHLLENRVNLLPPFAAALVGGSILGEQRNPTEQAPKADQVEQGSAARA